MKLGELFYISSLYLATVLPRLAYRMTQKYYLNVDSYAYLDVAKTGIMRDRTLLSFLASIFGEAITTEILLIFAGATTILVYSCCRKYADELPSFAASLMFAFSSLVWFNNAPGVFDKNAYTLFMIALIVRFMLIEDMILRRLLIFTALALFSVMWEGGVIMMFFVLFVEIVRVAKCCLIKQSA